MRWFALVLLIVAGCGKKPDQAPVEANVAPAQRPPEHVFPTKAQGKLQTIKLWLGSEELTTEIAASRDQEETGMMFRTNMPENTGMLFIFSGPMKASFWMKNTILPLSAGYIDPAGDLLEIHKLQPQDTNAVEAATANIQYVLEVNQGWFERHHIETGTLVRTEFGTLHDTFFHHQR